MKEFFAHESAYVDEGSEIGSGTQIWHFCHIMRQAKIGRQCTLGQNVFVANNVVIGDGCKIQNNVSLYEGITLEDHVFCGPSMVFTNVKNPRCEFPRRHHYMTTLIRRGASIGANATLVCGITLHEYAFVAAGAVVTQDVPAYALVAGVPAKIVAWMSAYGEVLKFNQEGYATDSTGTSYQKLSPLKVNQI